MIPKFLFKEAAPSNESPFIYYCVDNTLDAAASAIYSSKTVFFEYIFFCCCKSFVASTKGHFNHSFRCNLNLDAKLIYINFGAYIGWLILIVFL